MFFGVGVSCRICILLMFIYMLTVVDRLPRLGKRELICLLLFNCNYVVSVWRGFLFLWVLGMGYVILLWHSLSLPYNYLVQIQRLDNASVYGTKFATLWQLKAKI